jgi:hypothetical protein
MVSDHDIDLNLTGFARLHLPLARVVSRSKSQRRALVGHLERSRLTVRIGRADGRGRA